MKDQTANATQFIGIGLRRRYNDTVLDVWYPYIFEEKEIPSTIRSFLTDTQYIIPTTELEGLIKEVWPFTDELFSVHPSQSEYATSEPVVTYLPALDQPVKSAEEAYLKLHLLSRRKVQPHQLCLDQLFGQLSNIAWTNIGPILPNDIDHLRLKLWGKTEIVVSHVDKFPYLVNYVIPSGVRIASGSQVRLGAYLGEGTTVMPAGYINFNAGTMGNAMIEGRISAGVVVEKNSDIGGGASIMGTLSGGNKTVISIGAQCLLGANSGTGISLGTGCTIAAGLYIYAGMKIHCYSSDNQPINISGKKVLKGQNIVKASELSGRDYLLFIQDSISGEVKCLPNSKLIELNHSLHVNQ